MGFVANEQGKPCFKILPFPPISVKVQSMDRAEIMAIVSYLKDLEEGLYEIIRRLMDATFQTTDRKLKPFLATLEVKARRCKDCIETRPAVRN